MIALVIIGTIVAFFIYYFRLYSFLSPHRRLLVLMYHKISETPRDPLTVSVQELENQLHYLKKNGYNSLFFKDLAKSNSIRKKIIITFDDGYENNRQHLLPLLEKYGLKATIFIPTAFIENGYDDKMMTYEELRQLDPALIEIGLHSHSHTNFRKISPKEAEADILKNIQRLEEERVPFFKVFAYPYGKFPKKNPQQSELFKIFNNIGLRYAVRIGNKANMFPTSRPFEISRIGIEDRDGMARFRMKLILGKLKLF